MNSWKPIVAVLAIFGSGVLTGAFAVRIYSGWQGSTDAQARPAGGPPPVQAARFDLLRKMSRDLELDPAQRQQIEQILNKSQQRMRSIWDRVAPEAKQEMRQTEDLIRAELRPDQKARFEEIVKRGPFHRSLEKRPWDRNPDRRDERDRRDPDRMMQPPGEARPGGDPFRPLPPENPERRENRP